MIHRIKRFLSRLRNRLRRARINRTEVQILVRGDEVFSLRKRVMLDEEIVKWGKDLPLVSCLMVTKDRANFAKCAIGSFLNQTYLNKELLIVDDGESEVLAQYVKQLDDPRIRHIRLDSRNNTLGGLRNMSVGLAEGEFVCQWDDDDLSDPLRLSMQIGAILSFEADACLLKQELMWWPNQQRLAVSTERVWEGSCLSRKKRLIPYQDIPKGEDTPVITKILQTSRVVVLDNPYLYLYVVHGQNTFDSGHFDFHWVKADKKFENSHYHTLLDTLSLRMPINDYAAALRSREIGI